MQSPAGGLGVAGEADGGAYRCRVVQRGPEARPPLGDVVASARARGTGPRAVCRAHWQRGISGHARRPPQLCHDDPPLATAASWGRNSPCSRHEAKWGASPPRSSPGVRRPGERVLPAPATAMMRPPCTRLLPTDRRGPTSPPRGAPAHVTAAGPAGSMAADSGPELRGARVRRLQGFVRSLSLKELCSENSPTA